MPALRCCHLLWSAGLSLLLLSTEVHAQVQQRELTYSQGDTQLVGQLFAPAESTPAGHPGVLVIHEYWGLNEHARNIARQLAEAGYVALAVDMYGDGKHTEHPQTAGAWASQLRKEMPLLRARAAAGLAALQAQPGVDPQRIAAVGYCFGGTSVLQLAYSGAPVRGVISVHGNPLPADDADLPNLKAAVLILHGADDPHVKQETIDACLAQFRKTKIDWQMVSYGNTVHSFTNPQADRDTARYQPASARRAWAATLAFLAEVFGPPQS